MGIDHAQSLWLEGAVLPAHRRNLSHLRCPARRDRMGGVRAGQRRTLRALRDPFRLRAVGGARRGRQPQGRRSEHGLDADGLIFACAMGVEERIARRLGPTVRLGLGAANGIPREGRLVSFGIAGALRPGLAIGTVIDATRVVDENGDVLWEGAPLGIESARTGTILGASRIIDDASERAGLYESS